MPPSGAGRRSTSVPLLFSLCAVWLITEFTTALDPNAASDLDRNRYGDGQFGQRLLIARRLLKLGVPLVEVQIGGWDTHVDNARQTSRLCRQIDQPWVTLMEDLQSGGLWEDTLIVWMGEFGRTPSLNGRAGRDHYPAMTPVVLAGGDLGGRVVGRTNQTGTARVEQEHSIADLMATLLTLLGLDINAQYTTDFGSPTTVNGQRNTDRTAALGVTSCRQRRPTYRREGNAAIGQRIWSRWGRESSEVLNTGRFRGKQEISRFRNPSRHGARLTCRTMKATPPPSDVQDSADFGDQLESLFDDARGEILGTLFYLVGNMEDARDALQETFLKCWRRRDQIGDIANLKAWGVSRCFEHRS